MKILSIFFLFVGVASGQFERANFLSYADKMCVGPSAGENHIKMET